MDDDPPESNNSGVSGSGNFEATTGESFSINANFIDNIDIDNAEILIRMHLIESVWPSAVSMTETGVESGKFTITSSDLNINTTTNDSDYEYRIVCYDTSGNEFAYETNQGNPFIISILDNDNPIADAGPDIKVEVGTTVELNGNGSSDNIGIVSYKWSFIYNKLETNLENEKTSFKFEEIGNYLIFLTVKDANGNDDTDELTVTVVEKNFPPEITEVKPKQGIKVYVYDEDPAAVLIYVRFNEEMDIDENSVDFFFMNDSAGNPVSGSFNWLVEIQSNIWIYQLTFIPDKKLEFDETYTITVTTGVKEKFEAGLNLREGRKWTFETYAEDSDGDELPDSWEFLHWPERKINEVGPDADDDEDGFTNLAEFLGPDGVPGGDDSTDPRDKKSHPPIKGTGDGDSVNLILIVVIIIFIILCLLILVIAMMIRKKKKIDDEEKKKPTTIEHEILFDDEGGAPGVIPESAAESGKPPEELGGAPEPGAELRVELEPSLEEPTEKPYPEKLGIEDDLGLEDEIGIEDGDDRLIDESILEDEEMISDEEILEQELPEEDIHEQEISDDETTMDEEPDSAEDVLEDQEESESDPDAAENDTKDKSSDDDN
jgi:Na+-transporting methylmalonyl-CoA/oxaloacetate decarboxylase gamma subunit